MKQINFRSDPPNVCISRISPLDITSNDPIDQNLLTSFRSACISNQKISVTWDLLKTWLINHSVSKIWWGLTETERRSIGEHAIKNTIYYTIIERGTGSPGCIGTNITWKKAYCVDNSRVRIFKFGEPFNNVDSCYFKDKSWDIKCYNFNEYYKLPVFNVSARTQVGATDVFGHSMSGLQVNKDTTKYSSWVVFQYSDWDLKPGSRHIPTHKYDLDLAISKLTALDNCVTAWGDYINYWRLY